MIYKIAIAPRGAVGTPFRSDTLFGHACWALLFSKGEAFLDTFIQNARDQKPELVFSDGFPGGYLPKPLLPPVVSDAPSAEKQRQLKNFNKQKWISRAEAEDNDWKIDYTFLNKEKIPTGPEARGRLHNVVDRYSGSSLENNGLFSVEEEWYTGIWETIDIYISTEWSREDLRAFVYDLFAVGYGKDQSIGRGVVDIIEEPVLAEFPDYNNVYFLNLSRIVPDIGINLQSSFYDVETKYGKIWNGLEGVYNPFKKPIMQVVPGSVLCGDGTFTEIRGRVLTDICDDGRVIENCCGICYPLPKEEVQHAD